MMVLFLILLNSIVMANPLWKWVAAVDIVEKHEFYKNNETLVKPKNSWQTLFGVLYRDAELKTHKDCVFYRIPGEEPGVLKVTTIPQASRCEEYLFKPGDLEWTGLKALQFSLQPDRLSLYLTNSNFKVIRWHVPFFNVFSHPEPRSQMSSAAYRAPKMIFLTPHKSGKPVFPSQLVAESSNRPCHEINDDCSEKTSSTCSQCPEGWYEIPNGCPQGPKFCGRLACGGKNQPACRRGLKYQRRRIQRLECRTDSSFAYCSKGFQIQCEGNLPYCI